MEASSSLHEALIDILIGFVAIEHSVESVSMLSRAQISFLSDFLSIEPILEIENLPLFQMLHTYR